MSVAVAIKRHPGLRVRRWISADGRSRIHMEDRTVAEAVRVLDQWWGASRWREIRAGQFEVRT